MQWHQKMFFCNLFIMLRFWNPYRDNTRHHVLSISFGCQGKLSGNSESNIFHVKYLFKCGHYLSYCLSRRTQKLGCKRGMVRRSQRKSCVLKILFFTQNNTIQSGTDIGNSASRHKYHILMLPVFFDVQGLNKKRSG